MSHSDKWPHDVRQVNGARETFSTVVATIDKVFTNFGTGYSFVEDTTVDGQGRKPIWNMSGAFTNGKREDYAGVVYEAGDRIEVDLSLNPGRNGKIFYDVKRAAKVGGGTAVTQYETPPVVAAAPSPLDVKITKGMAFNNLTVALASTQPFFKDEDTLQAARSMWHMALEDAMAGKTPFSREADAVADAIVEPEVAAPKATAKAFKEFEGNEPSNQIDELVETLAWDGPSIEDLKQKGVALMTSKWDSPVDAGDELRKALGLPQDWSQMTAEQWQSVIAFAEAKD